MNRIYRLVWNATQQAWVVAGEFCRTHKKTKILFFEHYTFATRTVGNFLAGGTHLSDYYRTGDGKYSWRLGCYLPG